MTANHLKTMGLAAFAMALLSGCNHLPLEFGGKPEPSFAQQLNAMHASDRGLWRKNLRAHIESGRADLPPSHVALFLETLHQQRDVALYMKGAWLYLQARADGGPSLRTDTDREFLRDYAERAWTNQGSVHHQRLNRLCETLSAEFVCQQG